MEQPNTWHRGAPTSRRLKHDGRAIVSALTLSGDEYGIADEIDELPDPEAEASPLDAAKRKRGGA